MIESIRILSVYIFSMSIYENKGVELTEKIYDRKLETQNIKI